MPILQLRANANPEINELAEYIYEHVFKYYTMKQWGQTPEEIDPGGHRAACPFISPMTTAISRIPIR